jgi:hypothetical protein
MYIEIIIYIIKIVDENREGKVKKITQKTKKAIKKAKNSPLPLIKINERKQNYFQTK